MRKTSCYDYTTMYQNIAVLQQAYLPVFVELRYGDAVCDATKLPPVVQQGQQIIRSLYQTLVPGCPGGFARWRIRWPCR